MVLLKNNEYCDYSNLTRLLQKDTITSGVNVVRTTHSYYSEGSVDIQNTSVSFTLNNNNNNNQNNLIILKQPYEKSDIIEIINQINNNNNNNYNDDQINNEKELNQDSNNGIYEIEASQVGNIKELENQILDKILEKVRNDFGINKYEIITAELNKLIIYNQNSLYKLPSKLNHSNNKQNKNNNIFASLQIYLPINGNSGSSGELTIGYSGEIGDSVTLKTTTAANSIKYTAFYSECLVDGSKINRDDYKVVLLYNIIQNLNIESEDIIEKITLSYFKDSLNQDPVIPKLTEEINNLLSLDKGLKLVYVLENDYFKDRIKNKNKYNNNNNDNNNSSSGNSENSSCDEELKEYNELDCGEKGEKSTKIINYEDYLKYDLDNEAHNFRIKKINNNSNSYINNSDNNDNNSDINNFNNSNNKISKSISNDSFINIKNKIKNYKKQLQLSQPNLNSPLTSPVTNELLSRQSSIENQNEILYFKDLIGRDKIVLSRLLQVSKRIGLYIFLAELHIQESSIGYINDTDRNKEKNEDDSFSEEESKRYKPRRKYISKKNSKNNNSNNNNNNNNNNSVNSNGLNEGNKNFIEIEKESQQVICNFVDFRDIMVDINMLADNYREILPLQSLSKVKPYDVQSEEFDGTCTEDRYYCTNVIVVFKREERREVMTEYCIELSSQKNFTDYFIIDAINTLENSGRSIDCQAMVNLIIEALEYSDLSPAISDDYLNLIKAKLPKRFEEIQIANLKRFLRYPFLFFDQIDSIINFFSESELEQLSLNYENDLVLIYGATKNRQIIDCKLFELYIQKLLPFHSTHPDLVTESVIRSFVKKYRHLFIPKSFNPSNLDIAKTLQITLKFMESPVLFLSILDRQLVKLYKNMKSPNPNEYNQIIAFYSSVESELSLQKIEFQKYYDTVINNKDNLFPLKASSQRLYEIWKSYIMFNDIQQAFSKQMEFSKFISRHYDYDAIYQLIKEFKLEKIVGNFNLDAFIVIWKTATTGIIQEMSSNKTISYSLDPIPIEDPETLQINEFLQDKVRTKFKLFCSSTILRNQIYKHLLTRKDLTVVKFGRSPILLNVSKNKIDTSLDNKETSGNLEKLKHLYKFSQNFSSFKFTVDLINPVLNILSKNNIIV